MGFSFDDRPSAFTCDPGSPRTDVLGYSQSELSKLARKWPSGRRNLLNAWKRTWTSQIRLVLWQCFRPSISTHAKVAHLGMSGGGWTEWKKKLIWTSLTENAPGRQSWVSLDRTQM